MALTLTTPNTVLGALSPKAGTARLATNLATVVLGSLLLWAAAKISVPTVPVPVSLQTFAVAALAAAFGWRIAVSTLLLYIAEGLAGLPVFAYGGGIGYLLSPSFGFILGFVPMAFIIGLAADRGLSGKVLPLFGAMLAGVAVDFGFGFAWLLAASNIIVSTGAALPKWLDATNLLGTAFEGAVKPFVLWDIVKMAFAAVTVASVWQVAKKRG
ncbi:MAG: biotin transporter BioY [Proteobacteria bacterium]|nr:MAG: biotin transporter BioY [Pseudomonadota bacterium]